MMPLIVTICFVLWLFLVVSFAIAWIVGCFNSSDDLDESWERARKENEERNSSR